VKRRIAAVLMADVAGLSRALAEDAEAAGARRAEYRDVIADTVTHGGGRVLPCEGDGTLLAEFQSAVQAVRTALDAQETLRVRNKDLTLAQRLDFAIGITLGEVATDQAGDAVEVSPEALAGVGRLVSLATPGGVCISRSVREAIASKLKGQPQDLSVEGDPFEADNQITHATAYGAWDGATPPPARPSGSDIWTRTRVVAATIAAVLVVAIAAAMLSWRSPDISKPREEDSRVGVLKPAAPDSNAQATPKSKVPLGGGGNLEFMPALAPDPAMVLSAARMLPQAWKNCRDASADTAVVACKTLIDSGLAKGDELAEIQLLNGRALRDRHELDKALEAVDASIALKPTPQAYSIRGTVHYDKADWDRSISDYSEAIRLDAANGEAFNNRAWTYYRMGKPEKALPDADAAVRLLAKQAYVWDTRGHIHAALGDREAAISDFRASLAIDPSSADSQAGLAKLGVK
jgi:predicted negative regulator of RcsB-dependent stress response